MSAKGRDRLRENGFTLVEVMVALAIFGMIAAAGVGLLAFSIRAQAATTVRLDDTAAVERLAASLEADFAQALPRPTRNDRGDLQPAFVGAGGGADTTLVGLVRGGWSNLDAAPRPSEQKVEYRLHEGAIERIAYPMPDGATPFVTAPLIDHIGGVTLRYRYNGAWSDHWGGESPAPLPQAAELTIVRGDGTSYRQMFVVGTGYAPR